MNYRTFRTPTTQREASLYPSSGPRRLGDWATRPLDGYQVTRPC